MRKSYGERVIYKDSKKRDKEKKNKENKSALEKENGKKNSV